MTGRDSGPGVQSLFIINYVATAADHPPTLLRAGRGGNVDVDAFRRDQEGEGWRWLALAAGVFLLLELFAAWWFGRKV